MDAVKPGRGGSLRAQTAGIMRARDQAMRDPSQGLSMHNARIHAEMAYEAGRHG